MARMKSLKEKEMRRPSHSTSHLSWDVLRPRKGILGRSTMTMGERKARRERRATRNWPM
jgi:hypothetical protein